MTRADQIARQLGLPPAITAPESDPYLSSIEWPTLFFLSAVITPLRAQIIQAALRLGIDVRAEVVKTDPDRGYWLICPAAHLDRWDQLLRLVEALGIERTLAIVRRGRREDQSVPESAAAASAVPVSATASAPPSDPSGAATASDATSATESGAASTVTASAVPASR